MSAHPFPVPSKLALAVALALSGPATQAAVDCSVTVGSDDGTGGTPGTLSWAIMTANNGTTSSTPYPSGHPGGGCIGNLIVLKTNVINVGQNVVMKRLIDSDVTLQSDATIRTISGNSGDRPLFVKSGTVTIKNLVLANGFAKAGNASPGGGGAGMGGALFVYSGAVTVENVSFTGNQAAGGWGRPGYKGGSGGGSIFGNSGSGGGGLFAHNLGFSSGGYGGTGAYGGRGGDSANTNGGFGGGGFSPSSTDSGSGGFGGGGGGNAYGHNGGSGGFGGGGGASNSSNGGFGGFGGGGGGGSANGTGGFGGGNGGSGKGGGGAGLGGAIFVKSGTLSLKTVSFISNTSTRGTGGIGAANGQGLGGAVFICTPDLIDSGTNQAPTQCGGSIDEAASYGVTFSGGAATEGQPDLFWTQASGGAHSTAGMTDGIGMGTQTIAFGTAPSLSVGGTGVVSATGGASGNPVTFTSQTTGVCTTSGTNGSTITGVAAGTCTIAADQTGNANYGAAPQVTQTVTVGKGTQTIASGTAPIVAVGGTGTLAATGGSSGNPVTFASQTTGVCTVSGNTVTGVAAGTCIIAADQTGNANYNAAAQATQSFSIGAGTQTIAFGAAPSVVVGGTGTLTATGGGSGNPVTFASQTTGVCTVSGSTVTGVAAGTCTIAADQTGNANYGAATQVTQTVTVGKGAQTIIFDSAPTVAFGGTSTLTATGGSSGLPVTYVSQTPGVCMTSGTNGTTITALAAGTCTIVAIQSGNADYNASAPVPLSFTIAKANQAISHGTLPTVVVGGTGTLTATGGGSGNPVTFASLTTGVCTVSGSTLTGVTAGACTIAADQAGDANYDAAQQVTQAITVGKGTQTITFDRAPSVAFGGTGTVTATGGGSGNPVSYSSLTTGVCTVSGNTVTGVAAGTCIIAADQTGNASYNAAQQATQTFTVSGPAVGTATDCSVTVGTDDGTGGTPGTLSWAIMTANNGTPPSTPYPSGHPGGGCTNNTITLTTDVTVTGVMKRLIDSNVTLQSDTTTRTISGGNSYRPLFVKSGTVTINNLNLDNGRAQGGDGKYGGAGAGLGGALFIYTGTVMVENVGFTANRAQGGRGQGGSGFKGGGGMFGNSDSGGGGLFGNASGNLGGYGGTGAYGGHGGIGGTNGFGGFGGGGYASPSGGGYGGFGGGGGFGRGPGFEGGNFGGGGGASGGGGGFGGGGGRAIASFGGGRSGTVFGGGGAGFGGAIFVKRGTLSLKNASFTGNTSTGGTSEYNGQGKGGAVFICTPDLTDSGSNQAPNQCGGSIDEAASSGVIFSGGTAAEGQPDLFWTQASGGAHSTAGMTDGIGMGTQTIAFGTAPSLSVGGTGVVSATGGASGNPVTFTSQTTGICTTGGTNGSTVTVIAAGTCTIAASQAGNANYNAAQPATQSFVVSPFCSQCLPSRGGWRAILR